MTNPSNKDGVKSKNVLDCFRYCYCLLSKAGSLFFRHMCVCPSKNWKENW